MKKFFDRTKFPRVFGGILILGFFITVFNPLNFMLLAKTVPPQEFFDTVKLKNYNQFPRFFKVKIESSVVDLQFKALPEEMILFEQKPELFLLFKKNRNPILIVEGVNQYYVNYFAPYETVIQNTGIFLGIDQYPHYLFFSREFAYEVSQVQTGFKAKVRERQGLPGDYAIYHYNKDYDLRKVVFYKNKKKHGESKVYYEKFQDWMLPNKISVSFVEPEIGGLKNFTINFFDYQTDEELAKKHFVGN